MPLAADTFQYCSNRSAYFDGDSRLSRRGLWSKACNGNVGLPTCTRTPLKGSHPVRQSVSMSCTHSYRVALYDTQSCTTALDNHESNDEEHASCVSSPAVCSRQQEKQCPGSLPLQNSHRQEGQLKSFNCTSSSRQVYLQSVALIKIACRHILAAVVAMLSCWLSLVIAVLPSLGTMSYIGTVSPLGNKAALVVTSAHPG